VTGAFELTCLSVAAKLSVVMTVLVAVLPLGDWRNRSQGSLIAPSRAALS